MVLQDNVTNGDYYISTNKGLITTKFDRMITYLDGLVPTKSHDPLLMRSCGIHVTNQNHYISTASVPVTTKLGTVVTLLEGLLSL